MFYQGKITETEDIIYTGVTDNTFYYFIGLWKLYQWCFDASIWIWWHFDDDDITEISDFPEYVYTIESHQKKIQMRNLCKAQT